MNRSRVHFLNNRIDLFSRAMVPRALLNVYVHKQMVSLRKRQAARILFSMLRSSRRDMLTRGMGTWWSAAARRARDGKRLQGIVLRTAHRQRMFFLGKAWSRILWAAGEREAAKARKVCLYVYVVVHAEHIYLYAIAIEGLWAIPCRGTNALPYVEKNSDS